jgi:hypothetical protein
MAGYEDVVVTRIVQTRIVVRVVIDADASGSFLDGVQILGRIVMTVKVDDHKCPTRLIRPAAGSASTVPTSMEILRTQNLRCGKRLAV